jgi:hypothetical protein
MNWIDIKERLPEKGQKVIAYFDEFDIKANRDTPYVALVRCGFDESGKFMALAEDGHVYFETLTITHWMPIVGPNGHRMNL